MEMVQPLPRRMEGNAAGGACADPVDSLRCRTLHFHSQDMGRAVLAYVCHSLAEIDAAA